MYWLGQFITAQFDIRNAPIGEYVQVDKLYNGLGYRTQLTPNYLVWFIIINMTQCRYRKSFTSMKHFTFNSGLEITYSGNRIIHCSSGPSPTGITLRYFANKPYELKKNNILYYCTGHTTQTYKVSKNPPTSIKWYIGILTTGITMGITAVLLGRWFTKR